VFQIHLDLEILC